MTKWWHGLQHREQQLIGVASVLIVCLLIYGMLWHPLITARDSKRMQVQNNQALLIWMQTQANHIEQIKLANPNALQAANSRSLLATVDSLANQLGLRSAIQQIEPAGQHSATLWMDEINFDALITMLGELDRTDHINVAEANINKLEKAGMVKARIVVDKK